MPRVCPVNFAVTANEMSVQPGAGLPTSSKKIELWPFALASPSPTAIVLLSPEIAIVENLTCDCVMINYSLVLVFSTIILLFIV